MFEVECSFYYKCRTCFNQSKDLEPLSMLVTDEPEQHITYGELLKEVTNINFTKDKRPEMPHYICADCSRKLKSSHAFIKQAQEANDKFLSLLNDKDNLSEFDLHQEIKIESYDVGQQLCSYENYEPQYELMLKAEVPDDPPLSEDMKGAVDEDEVNAIKQPQDEYGIDSDSSRKDMDYSESESDEEFIPKDPIKTESINKEVSDQEDTDIAVRCLQCNKIFNNSKELRSHLQNTHVPEDQKCSCPQCGAKFTRPYSMYYHMRTQHGAESVKGFLPPTRERSYQCDKCHRKYSEKKYLNFHIKTKHSGEEDQSKSTVKQTKKISEVRHLCSMCGSSFPNKTQLTIHMRRHTGEMPFKCDLCDRAFPRASELKYHYRLHTGEKPYKCKICEKSFRVSAKLNSHMRSHTDDRPYKCNECERSFKYSKDLNIHKRIHTGEKPYSCNVCGNTFTQSNSLKAHRKKMGHMEEIRIN